MGVQCCRDRWENQWFANFRRCGKVCGENPGARKLRQTAKIYAESGSIHLYRELLPQPVCGGGFQPSRGGAEPALEGIFPRAGDPPGPTRVSPLASNETASEA